VLALRRLLWNIPDGLHIQDMCGLADITAGTAAAMYGLKGTMLVPLVQGPYGFPDVGIVAAADMSGSTDVGVRAYLICSGSLTEYVVLQVQEQAVRDLAGCGKKVNRVRRRFPQRLL
jgi:hypothetical protein